MLIDESRFEFILHKLNMTRHIYQMEYYMPHHYSTICSTICHNGGRNKRLKNVLTQRMTIIINDVINYISIMFFFKYKFYYN